MKEIEFKSGIFVVEIIDVYSLERVGYIKTFRLRSLGYSYEITQKITKAYRWTKFAHCVNFLDRFTDNRIKIYEKSKFFFRIKEVEVDIKLERKVKIEKLNNVKSWHKR